MSCLMSLVFLIAAASCYPTEHEENYDHHPANYKFDYSVHDPHTHDIKNHHESGHGDVVKGYYEVKDADGSTRQVHYTADHHNGFNAVVTRDGKPFYPEQKEAVAQVYQQEASHQGVSSSQQVHHKHGAVSSQSIHQY